MSQSILQVNFTFGSSRVDYEAITLPMAGNLACAAAR